MQLNDDVETQSEGIDLSPALAEISSDLFGQGEDEGEEEDDSAEGEPSEDTGEPSPDELEEAPQPEDEEGEEEEDNSEEVQAVGAPKTWTKEALEKWATVDPVVQQEVLKREDDFLKGISMYKGAAELGHRYDQVVEPYRPLLAAENIDPVQLFQSFSANHYLLTRGTPEQKLQLAANLILGYGIPLDQLNGFIGEQTYEAPDPQIVALQREIAELRSGFQQQTNAQTEVIRGKVNSDIDAFAADPAHPYFDEISEDIAKFIETGLATSLQEAYDKAVYANPTTRQKEIDRVTAVNRSAADAVEKARLDKIARSTADHVKTESHSRNGTIPLGSMDDTLEDTYREISSRG